jgi:hypothetical protein
VSLDWLRHCGLRHRADLPRADSSRRAHPESAEAVFWQPGWRQFRYQRWWQLFLELDHSTGDHSACSAANDGWGGSDSGGGGDCGDGGGDGGS